MLAKIRKLGAKPCNTLMIPNIYLTIDYGDLFNDPKRYEKLVRKVNYLTIMTRQDIAFVVSIVS